MLFFLTIIQILCLLFIGYLLSGIANKRKIIKALLEMKKDVEKMQETDEITVEDAKKLERYTGIIDFLRKYKI